MNYSKFSTDCLERIKTLFAQEVSGHNEKIVMKMGPKKMVSLWEAFYEKLSADF